MTEVTTKKSAPFLIKIVLVIMSLIVGLLMIEIGLRVILRKQTSTYTTDEYGYTIHKKNLDTTLFSQEQNKEVHIKTNNEGFIGTNYQIERKPNVLRIAILGDSFVEALDVDTENTFVALLEKALNAQNQQVKYEVMNFGVGGQGTVEELIRYYHYVKKYKPDYVVLVFFTNDFVNNQYYLDQELLIKNNDPAWKKISLSNANNNVGRKDIKFKLLQYSYTVRYLDQRVRKNAWLSNIAVKIGLQHRGVLGAPRDGIHPNFFIYQKPLPPEYQRIYSFTTTLIQFLAERTKEDNAQLIVTYLPEAIQVDKKLWQEKKQRLTAFHNYTWDFDQPNTLLSEAGATGVPFLDLTSVFRNHYQTYSDSILYNRPDGHLNEQGNQLVTQSLQDFFNKLFQKNSIR